MQALSPPVHLAPNASRSIDRLDEEVERRRRLRLVELAVRYPNALCAELDRLAALPPRERPRV